MQRADAVEDAGFQATAVFDGDESFFGTTKKGEPFLLVRGVDVDTGQERLTRTLMAFGTAIEQARPLLHPGRPVRLVLRDAGSIMKVVDRQAA